MHLYIYVQCNPLNHLPLVDEVKWVKWSDSLSFILLSLNKVKLQIRRR